MSGIYLAARYARHPEMREYAAQLTALGHRVTSRWIYGALDAINSDPGIDKAEYALQDLDDIRRSDLFVAFSEDSAAHGLPGNTGGRHVELGVAIAARTRIILVGPRENVFCWLPGIQHEPTWAACLAALSGEATP